MSVKYTQSMVQILHPQAKRNREGTFAMHDYVTVPRLSTHGEWRLMDMISDDSIRNAITTYNRLKH